MIGGYWLALVPTSLGLIGFTIAIWRFVRRATPQWFLLLGLSAAIAFGLIFMTLKVPSYAQVKAFYGLAALVPFCAFAVLGWQTLSARSRALRGAISAFLIFFSINSFASVWINRTSEQHIYVALRSISQSQPDRAISEATEATKNDTTNANAACFLAAVLEESGDSRKAVAESERGIQLDETNGDCHFQLGVSLGKQGDLARAMNETQRAVALEPENPRAYDLLFTLARELHRSEDALAAGRDALAVSPFDSDLHYRLGLAAGEISIFTTATQQFAYALLLNPEKIEYEEKLRLALSFLAQSPDAGNAIQALQPLAMGSPKLLEILAPYRQNPDLPSQDRQ